nr:MAG TPA: hypothetical protein [Caudoviricetes sp.]
MRYNKNHDPNTGRFCSGNGLTVDGKSDIISNELLNKAIQEGTISTKLDKRKQGAHIKGNSEYLSRI